MQSGENKKNNHYGVLCGLRASALGDSDSDRSHSSTPEPPPKDDIHNQASNVAHNQRRPQSLTLPFENRERESHLVSDEEFDRIVRQAELENDIPPLPTGRTRTISVTGLRRSISTARNNSFLKQRPVSMDVSTMVALSAAQNEARRQPVAFSRESTLTAMPRPPTMNELAVYPCPNYPVYLPEQQSRISRTHMGHQRNHTSANDQTDVNAFKGLFQQGHKRNRSSAQIVESVKKRLKRSTNSPSASPEGARSSPSNLSTGSPIRYPTSDAASAQCQHGQPLKQPRLRTDSSVFNAFPKPVNAAVIPPNDNLKKSLLTRTWSRTKQHARKLSISQNGSIASRPSISDPISLDMRPDTALSDHTVASAAASTATSHYYGSAEPSPRQTHESSRAATPDSEERNREVEFISGPPPKKNVLTRMGAPPRRSELNTVVARQQSRIADLTLLNNVLVQQVENLRGEVEGMRVESQRNRCAPRYDRSDTRDGSALAGSDCGNSLYGRSSCGNVQENHGYVSGKRESDGTASAWSSSVSARRRISSGKLQRDPEGWRHIMGIAAEEDGERMDVEEISEDKRKTWMTCDSEA